MRLRSGPFRDRWADHPSACKTDRGQVPFCMPPEPPSGKRKEFRFRVEVFNPLNASLLINCIIAGAGCQSDFAIGAQAALIPDDRTFDLLTGRHPLLVRVVSHLVPGRIRPRSLPSLSGPQVNRIGFRQLVRRFDTGPARTVLQPSGHSPNGFADISTSDSHAHRTLPTFARLVPEQAVGVSRAVCQCG